MAPCLTRRATLRAAAAASLVAPGNAMAQGSAGRPLRILTGFTPGGSVDIVARLLADGLRGRVPGIPVVENRPGAAGRLALEAVRAGDPDGSLLLVTPAGHLTIMPHVYGRERLRYAPEDFAPVSPLARFPFGFIAGPAVPEAARAGLPAFIAWARAQREVTIGLPNLGSTPHFLALELARGAGFRAEMVPYRGAAPGLADAMGGRLPLFVAPLPSVIAQHRAGQLRLVAITAPQRSPAVPEVAVFAELPGLPATLALEEWHGLFAPARTPPALVAALNRAAGEVLALPATREGMAKLELTPFHEEPAAFAARQQAELAAWGPVVAASGFRPEE